MIHRLLPLLLCVCLAASADESPFNTDMVRDPAAGEKRGVGQVVTYHKGKGRKPQGYVMRHEPGEVAEFWLFVPEGLKKGKRYPLLITYHGGKDGGSGRGLARSLGKVSTEKHPVFVLSPNMYTTDAYDEILEEGKHAIDPARVVVMGFSSGGYGVRAAWAWMGAAPDRIPFRSLVCMSTASAPSGARSDTPYVVVAGEKETPEFMKHPALKQRRMACRQHAVGVYRSGGGERRYVEVQAQGHACNKPPHVALLRNLLRGAGQSRFSLDVRKPRPEVETLLDMANNERWKALRAEGDRLEAAKDSKTKSAYGAIKRKLESALGKWVDEQLKTIVGRSKKSTHVEITQSLHTHDELIGMAAAFEGTTVGDRIAKALKKLEKARHWQSELAARKRFREAARTGDAAALKKLAAELPDTEYGRNRTKELLLAMQR